MSDYPLAIFAALDSELKPLRSRLLLDETIYLETSKILIGNINNRPVILVQTGIGGGAMTKAARWCFENLNPALCVNTGCAGGASPSLGIADIVAATHVVNAKTKERIAIDPALLSKIETLCKDNDVKISFGGIVTVDKVIPNPHKKAFIGTEFDAAAIDMESFYFIEQCVSFKKSAFVARVIMDPLDYEMPLLNDIMDANGGLKKYTLVKELVRRPQKIPAVYTLGCYSNRARTSIGSFFEAWIK